jgi:hypothetical protein
MYIIIQTKQKRFFPFCSPCLLSDSSVLFLLLLWLLTTSANVAIFSLFIFESSIVTMGSMCSTPLSRFISCSICSSVSLLPLCVLVSSIVNKKYFKFNFCWSCSLGESWQTKGRNSISEMGNLYRGPSIDASYQVSVHLAKQFRRRFKKICQSETRIACGGHVY